MTERELAPHVVVVGGGIAGLTAAYTLQEQAREDGRPIRITLLEGETRTGGKIVTDTVDGFVIEGGPDSLLAQKPWAADLCRRLGLGDELIGTNDDRRATYILSGGQLHSLPEGMALIAPTKLGPFLRSSLFSWRGKLRMLLDLVLPRRRIQGDESVASFVRRRLGQEAVEKLAEPLMAGIHAGDPERQSLAGTFPRFVEMERKQRSLILGSSAARKATPAASSAAQPGPSTTFVSLRGGIGRLVEALNDALVDVCVERRCSSHPPRNNNQWLPHQHWRWPDLRCRCRDPGDTGLCFRRFTQGHRLCTGSHAPGHPLSIDGDCIARLSARRGRPSAQRLRLCHPAQRGSTASSAAPGVRPSSIIVRPTTAC